MLYIFKNPRVRRNPNRRPLDETLRAALITDASQRRLLSRFPGIVNATAGFPAKDYARFEKSMKSVEDLLTSSPFYKAPVDRSTGKPFKYRPYQISGITFMLSRRGRGLIMDPMGLGKTLQGIGLLVAGGGVAKSGGPWRHSVPAGFDRVSQQRPTLLAQGHQGLDTGHRSTRAPGSEGHRTRGSRGSARKASCGHCEQGQLQEGCLR